MENNVSIIIPTYKRGDVIRKTLPSYLRQKSVKEIIVVDDSGFAFNDINGLIKSHQLIKYYSPEKRLGLPGARNFGLEKATGDFIIFGEDDVEFTPNYVKILLEQMEKENADIIGGRQIFLHKGDNKASALANAQRLKEKDLYLNYPADINFSVDLKRNIELHALLPFALFRKGVFSGLRYDENLKGNYHREETDLYVSALEKGFKIVFCHIPFVWHHRHMSQKGGCRIQFKLFLELSLLKNDIYFWKKHYKFLKGHLKLRSFMLYYILSYHASRYLNNAREMASRVFPSKVSGS